MKSHLPSAPTVRRTSLVLLCLLALVVSVISSRAFTTVQFAPVQAQLTNDIAVLSAIENPSRTDRMALRTLSRATNVLNKSSLSDGKALRMLNNILHRNPNYT